MNEKTAKQIENLKKQTIGVEIEMNHITRERAARLAADHFGTGRYEYTARRNGYSTWSAWDARIVGTAEIPNYQLLFKGSKTGSYLTIEPKQGCTVPVAVWSVSERDELALDRYEGYPHFYYKTELELPLAETGKKLTAFVYIMHEERKLGIPTSAYIRTCVDGYRQFGFDLKHLRKAMDISEREVYHHENG